MASLFKRKIRGDKEGYGNKGAMEIINSISKELMAENCVLNEEKTNTNKLPELPDMPEMLSGYNNCLVFSESDTGAVRQNNQDSTFTGVFKFNISNRTVCIGMGIVADGMGGLSMGEVASTTAVTSISIYLSARLSQYVQDGMGKKLPHGSVIMGNISDSIKNSNNIIWNKGNSLSESIGTTLTCAVVVGSVAYFGHAGDSRAYIINTERKTMEKVTRDHSLVGRLVEMGHITEEEARNHPRRNEIYRMLGLRSEIEVDTYYRMLNRGDIIVMMSDGLWEFVDDKVILDEVLKCDDYGVTAKKLVNLANKNGGQDNISVVIIKPVD